MRMKPKPIKLVTTKPGEKQVKIFLFKKIHSQISIQNLFSVTKDLAKLSNDKIRRRHSITLCESRHRKSSTESTISNCSSERSQISPDRPIIDNHRQQFTSLNVAAIQDQTVQEFDVMDHSSVPKPLKTLDLRLEEVAHIRSVLTKAELEAMPIDSYVRDSVARGKVRCIHSKAQLG